MGFDIIDIRRFEAQEFAPLLEAESQAWREDLRWDFTASARVISNCLREKRLSGYALVCEGRVQGYCYFFYDAEKGLIGDLFVQSSAVPLCGMGHVSRLLDHSIETLLGTPGLRRVEAQLPHFDFEELAPCFSSRHFDGYRRLFMALSLEERPRLPAPSGASSFAPAAHSEASLDDIQVVPWERRYEREAAQLLYTTYRNHVDAIINDQYASLEGTTRLLENILHHQGCGEFLPLVSRLALHRSSRRLAGILAVTAVRPHTAHIPQVAVAGPFQGGGLGTRLMEGAFQDLTRQGYREVSLTVTDANAGAVRLYKRLGFQTFRTFGAFVFNLL